MATSPDSIAPPLAARCAGASCTLVDRLHALLTGAAAVGFYFVALDVLIGAGAYIAMKSGDSLATTAAYGAGHAIGLLTLALLLAHQPTRNLIATAFDHLAGPLSRPRGVLGFVALITALRLAWVLLIPTTPTSDSAIYHRLADTWLTTGAFGTPGVDQAYWPPGYPAFLAALYALFGTSVFVAKLANIVLAAAVDLLTWHLVRTRVGPRAAAAALLLTAAWLGRNAHVDVLSYDELVVLILLGSLVLLPRSAAALDRTAMLRFATAGLLLGFGCLVRPTLGVTPAVVLGWLLVQRVSLPRAVAGTALYGTCMLAAVAPWTMRNNHVFGRLVPITTGMGSNFYASWAPGSTGDCYSPATHELFELAAGDELAQSRLGMQRGWQSIRQDPVRAARIAVQKQGHYLGSDNWLLAVEDYTAALGNDAAGRALKLGLHTITNAWYLVLMLLPALLVRDVRCGLTQSPLAWLCLVTFLLGMVIHTVFQAQARYHLIYLPLWSILVAILLTRRTAPAVRAAA